MPMFIRYPILKILYKINTEKFYKDYELLCAKYFTLVMYVQGEMYQKNMISFETLAKSFAVFCIGAVEHFPDFDKVKDSLAGRVYSMAEYWTLKRAEKSRPIGSTKDIPGIVMARENEKFSFPSSSIDKKVQQ